MATYKVIQDIEAEDKFLGPLTLKQFIFGVIALFFAYLSFFAVTKGATFLVVVFMPPALLAGFLAVPWSSDQPTELWVLAKLRFKLKPRSRIWDQAGLEELVTVTVPKKIEKQLTNGLDATEVQSRLKALAETIDTRGWAVKNATSPDVYTPRGQVQAGERLINLDSLPSTVPDTNVTTYEDMLSEDNAISSNFEHMIQNSSMLRKQQSLDKMERVRRGEPIIAPLQTEANFTPPADSYAQQWSGDETTLSQQLKNNRAASNVVNTNLKKLPVYPEAGSLASTMPKPMPPQPAATTEILDEDNMMIPEPFDLPGTSVKQAAPEPPTPVTNGPDPAIVDLARRNDLNIATVSRMANKKSSGDEEVVISLR